MGEEESMNRAKTEISATERLREQGAVIGEDLHEMGRLTGEIAKERLDRTREAANDLYRRGQERMAGYVKEQPLRTLAIAAAAGVVLGLLLGRRR
jgi:ElaB/YqjD/DUF883 family membrane-anchored ribosome-binding protein